MVLHAGGRCGSRGLAPEPAMSCVTVQKTMERCGTGTGRVRIADALGGWRGRREHWPSPTDAAPVFVSAEPPLRQLAGEKLHPNQSLRGKGTSPLFSCLQQPRVKQSGRGVGKAGGKTGGNRSSSLPSPKTAQCCPSCAPRSVVFPRASGVPGARGAELFAVD